MVQVSGDVGFDHPGRFGLDFEVAIRFVFVSAVLFVASVQIAVLDEATPMRQSLRPQLLLMLGVVAALAIGVLLS